MVDIYEQAARFPPEEYRTLEEARDAELEVLAEMNQPHLPAIEDTLTFSRNPRRFVNQGGNRWQDRTTREIYTINSVDEICPWDGSVKVRLALHLVDPQYFVAILCPSVLGQTDGEPKMYAALSGTEFANTRPNGDPPLHVLSFVGMSIDQLRARVLSVYLDRIVLIKVGQKWPDVATGKELSGKGGVCNLQLTKLDPVKPIPGYGTFAAAKTLPLASALQNVDPLSIYMTGHSSSRFQTVPSIFPLCTPLHHGKTNPVAKTRSNCAGGQHYYNKMIEIDEDLDIGTRLQWRSQLAHRWNSNGM